MFFLDVIRVRLIDGKGVIITNDTYCKTHECVRFANFLSLIPNFKQYFTAVLGNFSKE